jgi:hypothetical protein
VFIGRDAAFEVTGERVHSRFHRVIHRALPGRVPKPGGQVEALHRGLFVGEVADCRRGDVDAVGYFTSSYLKAFGATAFTPVRQ